MRTFSFLFVIALSAVAAFGQAASLPVETGEKTAMSDAVDKAVRIEPLAVNIDVPEIVPITRPKDKLQQNPEAGSSQTSTGYTRPDSKTRTKRYINNMFGPFAFAQSATTAGIATWRNSPEEWGPQWEGFGKRFASNIGRNVIRQSIIFGMDEALKLDSHFYRSEKRDARSRAVNALISPVTARKANGKRTIGIPRLAGVYAANIIAVEAWYPEKANYKDALRAGTIALGFNAAFNLVKEFILKK